MDFKRTFYGYGHDHVITVGNTGGGGKIQNNL